MKLSDAQIAGLKEVEEDGHRFSFHYKMRWTTLQRLMSLELIEFKFLPEHNVRGVALTEKGRQALQEARNGKS